MEASEKTNQSSDPKGPIVARAGRYYRIARYIMVAILFGYGLYSILDGFYRYPKANTEALEKQRQEAIARGANPDTAIDPEKVPHPGLDIPFNQVIGCVLPPLSILYLFYMLHKSRGEYRLEGTTLHVPGHPAVPFENITEIDKRLWDRKGIVFISYDMGNGEQGTLKLDDFIYERDPTDEIFKRIEQFVAPSIASQPDAQEKTHG